MLIANYVYLYTCNVINIMFNKIIICELESGASARSTGKVSAIRISDLHFVFVSVTAFGEKTKVGISIPMDHDLVRHCGEAVWKANDATRDSCPFYP